MSEKMLSLQRLLTIQILISCIYTSMTLPVTSKPIENTPENLAWEAWIMFPPATQDKTRKVSPKSIFILPNKIKNNSEDNAEQGGVPLQCPPGQKVYDMKCIPTVSIDRDQILITQLTNLLQGGDNPHDQVNSDGMSIPYDYDYDYGDENLGQEILTPAVKVDESANAVPQNPEEPLKVQIFIDKFPPVPPSQEPQPSAAALEGMKVEEKVQNNESLEQAESINSHFWQERNRSNEETTTVSTTTPPTTTTTPTPTTSTTTPPTTTIADDITTTSKPQPVDDILPNKISANPSNVVAIVKNDDQQTTPNQKEGEIELLQPFDSVTEKKADFKQVLADESLMFADKTTTTMIQDTTENTTPTTVTIDLATDQTTMLTDLNEEAEESTTMKLDDDSTSSQDEEREVTEFTDTPSTMQEEEQEQTTGKETTAQTETPTPTDPEVNESMRSATQIAQNPSEENATSDKRFIYHHMSSTTEIDERKKPSQNPKKIDINEELKIINRLVAANRKKIIFATERTSRLPMIFRANPATTTTTTTTTESPSSQSQSSGGLWWLPSGWKVDQTGDKPLLLRFWSKIPGL